MENKRFSPKISIIIPVYNGSNYLAQAIESALAQTYENFEVIVVNDGSDDGGKTEQTAKGFEDQIRYFYKENGGVSSALNFGIGKMEGEYFSWLSHDDKYTPYKLEHLVALLAQQEDARLVALTGVTHIDSNAQKVKNVPYYFVENKIYSGTEVTEYILNHGTFNGCAMLIPKAAFVECGGFHEGLRYNQDSLMWHQIFGSGYRLIADTVHHDVMYRLHANQTSKLRRDLLLHDSFEMAKLIAPTFAAQSTPKHNLLRLYAKRNARHDCADAVRECVRVGTESRVFGCMDVLYLKMWLILGKGRNILKKLYVKVRLKITD